LLKLENNYEKSPRNNNKNSIFNNDDKLIQHKILENHKKQIKSENEILNKDESKDFF